MQEIIEGRWDDLVATRHDLQGRDVRVIVLEQDEKPRGDAWLKAFHDWVNSHKPVNHFVDDSREKHLQRDGGRSSLSIALIDEACSRGMSIVLGSVKQ